MATATAWRRTTTLHKHAAREESATDEPVSPWGKSRARNNRRKNAAALIAVIALISVIALGLSQQSVVDTSASPATRHRFALPAIPDDISAIECHKPFHQYEFASGKVRWTSERTIYSIEERGISMHCLLTRAAKRLPADFCTKICLALSDAEESDVDLHQKQQSHHSFVPAFKLSNSTVKNSTTLLFPDFTFESWPRSNDYYLPNVMADVLKAAAQNGLPNGSSSRKWKKRKPKLLWRGSPYGNQRKELANHSSPLFDIQSIVFNLTKTRGMKITSNNQVSRAQHCESKYLLHLNGIFNNRYSSAIKWKLMCGSLVFAPAEPFFAEWWTTQIQPYQHYIPFNSTVHLLELLEYYSRHDDEAMEVAQRGMELATEAVLGVNDWVDETLKLYAKKTQHLDLCSKKNHSRPFKSLEDIQLQYGPMICA